MLVWEYAVARYILVHVKKKKQPILSPTYILSWAGLFGVFLITILSLQEDRFPVFRCTHEDPDYVAGVQRTCRCGMV